MKRKISKRKLAVLIVIFPLTVLFVYGGMTYLFLSYMQSTIETSGVELKLKEKYRKRTAQRHMRALQTETRLFADAIAEVERSSRAELLSLLEKGVTLQAEIANNLCHRYRGVLKKRFLKRIVLTALKGTRIDARFTPAIVIGERGYIYHFYDQSLEGKNILTVEDDTGNRFGETMVKVAKEEGKGYVDYSWYRSAHERDMMYYNLTYVRKIDCFGWIVGGGIFLDELEFSVRRQVDRYVRAHAKLPEGYFILIDKRRRVRYIPEGKSMPFDTESLDQLLEKGSYREREWMAAVREISSAGLYLIGISVDSVLSEEPEVRRVVKAGGEAYDIRRNLALLFGAWLISMLVSIYLSRIIYKYIKSYEEEIHRSNEKMMFQSKQALIGELFSMIAHQWRQPINKIASIVALERFRLQKGELKAEELDKTFEEIEESVEFMSETIDDFRTFYKPTSGTKLLNLKTLIKRSIFFLKNSIQKHDIKVITHLEDIEIELYRNEFLQVMLNLIKNAIDAIGSQGVIIVRLYREGEYVIISVENSGKPIDREVAGRIFEPYFTTKEDSMGLGLYMTKIIVEKHMGGEITVEALHDGTIFTITIPQERRR